MINLKLLGNLQEIAGASEVKIVGKNISLIDLLRDFATNCSEEMYGKLFDKNDMVRDYLYLCINDEPIDKIEDTIVKEYDSVLVIPPIAGG